MGKKKEKMIRVMSVEVGKSLPQVKVIENTLEKMQSMVDGYIEVIGFGNVLCIINEEGKLNELEPNFAFPVYHDGENQYYDVIVGNVIFVGDDGLEFRGLTDKELEEAYKVVMEGRFTLNIIVQNKKR